MTLLVLVMLAVFVVLHDAAPAEVTAHGGHGAEGAPMPHVEQLCALLLVSAALAAAARIRPAGIHTIRTPRFGWMTTASPVVRGSPPRFRCGEFCPMLS